VHLRLLLAFAGLVSVAATQAVPAPEALARALERKYTAVSDFSADFVHAYRGGVLRKQVIERGTVLIKKPARMRWTYVAPEEKVFVSDGTRFYSYIPADKQVIVSRIPRDDEATTPVLFLAGKGDLVKDFVASFPSTPDTTPGTYSITLTPRRHEAEFDWLMLVVDRTTLGLRKLVTVDGQGGQSTFIFSNVRENVGLTDKLFQFAIPRGVEVITSGPSSD
jgi:outer membrane lipoprotein carrier protein